MTRRRDWEAGDWPSPDRSRTRVLVESSDAADQWALGKVLRTAGYEVAVCDGPSVFGAPCPLVRGGDCALAAGADVIVNLFHLDERANQDVIRALRAYRPATPVVVESRPKERDRHADVLNGCRFVSGPLTSKGMLAAVNDACADAAAARLARADTNGRTGS
jgi:hypothetical protein